MTKKQIVKAIEELIAWPPEDYPRRTEDGYPEELVYDDFAYFRMVDTCRRALGRLKNAIGKPLKRSKKSCQQ